MGCYDSNAGMPWYGIAGIMAICILLVGSVMMCSLPWIVLCIDRSKAEADTTSVSFVELTDDLVKGLPEKEFREMIWNNQRALYAQQESHLADIRQETNNVIEKSNAWMSFWIAVLAFLGVLVPIALNHRAEKKRDEDLVEFKDLLEKKYNALALQTRNQIKESTDQESKREEEFKTLKEKEKSLQRQLEMQMCLSTLSSVRDNRLVPEDYDSKITFYNLTNRALESFDELVKIKFKDDEYVFNDEEKRFWVSVCVELYEIAMTIQLEGSGEVRTREVHKVSEEIKHTIRMLNRKAYGNIDELKNSLEKIKGSFNAILPLIVA